MPSALAWSITSSQMETCDTPPMRSRVGLQGFQQCRWRTSSASAVRPFLGIEERIEAECHAFMECVSSEETRAVLSDFKQPRKPV